jgi:hypothetical protein
VNHTQPDQRLKNISLIVRNGNCQGWHTDAAALPCSTTACANLKIMTSKEIGKVGEIN